MSDDDLQANYARAFDGKAGFGSRPALILIDFVAAYFTPGNDLHAGVEDALASAMRVREAAREAGVFTVLTTVTYHPSGIDGGRFYQKTPPLRNFLPGRESARWAEGLEPRDDELVIAKQYPSAFFGTSLASTLHAMGVDNVILTGLSTSGCVRASCVDSMSHGFITTVVRDACGDRHPGPHEANLFDMQAKYADVVSEEEILAHLRSLPID